MTEIEFNSGTGRNMSHDAADILLGEVRFETVHKVLSHRAKLTDFSEHALASAAWGVQETRSMHRLYLSSLDKMLDAMP